MAIPLKIEQGIITQFTSSDKIDPVNLAEVTQLAEGQYLMWDGNRLIFSSSRTLDGGSAGAYHAGAIHSDGSLWMWGLNGSYQCGDTNPSQLPRTIASPRPGIKWSRIFCGEYATAAILEDGSLWVWGANNNGQLGVGDTNSRSSPTNLPGDWKFCQIGYSAACGIKTDGSLWVWGSNQSGLIGLGSGVSQSTAPTRVGLETGWTMAYPMGQSTVALKRA